MELLVLILVAVWLIVIVPLLLHWWIEILKDIWTG